MNVIDQCRSCALCNNQKPLIQAHVNRKVSTFFVGLSAVQVECVDLEEPFSKETKSGALLRDVASFDKECVVYFTNAVKCLPLKDGKIRYPAKSEMESCFPNFEMELNEYSPSKLVLFGNQVSNFIINSLGASLDNEQPIDGVSLYSTSRFSIMVAPHPSYMLIYKRKNIDWYIDSIRRFCSGKVNSNNAIQPTVSPLRGSAASLQNGG